MDFERKRCFESGSSSDFERKCGLEPGSSMDFERKFSFEAGLSSDFERAVALREAGAVISSAKWLRSRKYTCL